MNARIPTESSTDVSTHPWALTHPPATFWLRQAVIWALIHAVLFVPNHHMAVAHGATSADVLWQTAHSAVFALLASAALARLYERLPERMLRGSATVATVLGACLVAAAVWTAVALMIPMVDLHQLAPPPLRDRPVWLAGLFWLRGVFLLAMWSAMFLMVMFSHRMQVARERTIVATSRVQQAQLDLLRSQVNPHFLFNSLNSVVGLITEDPKGAQQMVRDVASLLRQALDVESKKRTTVRDEVQFIKLYLRCEKVRFEDRLHVAIEIPDELLNVPLPSMLLHPLVENAVKHGMVGKRPLELLVAGSKDGERVVLEVKNSGDLSSPRRTPKPGAGIGLRNVQERVQSLFPESGTFELTDGDGWVTARITFTPEEKRQP